MFKHRFSIVMGAAAVIAVVAVPAGAADDIEQKTQGCGACHGQNGAPADPKTTPIIWGQQGNYLFKELHDYRSGDRNSPIMSPLAQGLSLDDLRKVAAYFAAKSWPAGPAADASAAAPEGIGMCRACHGRNFEGGAPA